MPVWKRWRKKLALLVTAMMAAGPAAASDLSGFFTLFFGAPFVALIILLLCILLCDRRMQNVRFRAVGILMLMVGTVPLMAVAILIPPLALAAAQLGKLGRRGLIFGLSSGSSSGKKDDMTRLASIVSGYATEDAQKNVLIGATTAAGAKNASALVNSPVPGCETTDNCFTRSPEYTANPVISRIYGLKPEVQKTQWLIPGKVPALPPASNRSP